MKPDFDVLDHGGWHGLLNEESLVPIVNGIRKMFVGKKFLVVSCNYLSSWDPRIEVSQNERFNSRWSNPPYFEPVRIFDVKEASGIWFGFSTGGYFYSYRPAPAGQWENKEKEKYPHFSFDIHRQSLTIKTIAPSGDTHQSVFQVQQKLDKED